VTGRTKVRWANIGTGSTSRTVSFSGTNFYGVIPRWCVHGHNEKGTRSADSSIKIRHFPQRGALTAAVNPFLALAPWESTSWRRVVIPVSSEKDSRAFFDRAVEIHPLTICRDVGRYREKRAVKNIVQRKNGVAEVYYHVT
jgi:hypothetical protein